MTRRKSTKKDVASDTEDSSSSLKPAHMKVKRKKRKTVNSKHASDKSRALLQLMVDMPVDVLLEIFKHLELVDLMHLSRTSKALRSILMSRSSISVWKQAVANDGLPQCTKDLNEPQLAELMFGKSCDWCGRNVSGQEIIWGSRVRACKRCIGLAFKPAQNVEYGRYPDELAKLIPSVIIKNKKYIDGDLDRKWHEEYVAKRSEDETSKWLEALVAERRVISEHAAACEEWFKSRHETRVMLRKAEILERLKERGWQEELDKLIQVSGPTNLIEVVKACQSELTEPILASLDNVLDKFMEDAKAARLVREKKQFFKRMLEKLREIFREYSHTLPPNHILPNTADIYFHPIVNTALSAVESHDDEALEEALTGIQPLLPEIVDDCLRLSKQRLTNLVIDDYTQHNKSFDMSVLTLASTLFYCKKCHCDFTLDQIVSHENQTSYYPGYYYRLSEDMEAVRSAISEVTTTHKIQGMVSFSLARLEPFASVLHSCGIDPNTTTAADMDEIDPIIECLDCSSVERGRVTMKWLSIAKHITKCHTTNMTVLDEPEANIVRARMLEQYQKDTARTKEHICAHCRDSGGSMALMQHVKQNHHINSPVYGQDVVVSPTATGIRTEFNLWPPIL